MHTTWTDVALIAVNYTFFILFYYLLTRKK